jgi:hypothetical protein
VDTELGRSHRVNAVVIPEMSEQPPGNGLMVHSRTKAVEIRQRLGVPLTSLFSVAPDNLLEAGVLGHDKPPLGRMFRSSATSRRRERNSD